MDGVEGASKQADSPPNVPKRRLTNHGWRHSVDHVLFSRQAQHAHWSTDVHAVGADTNLPLAQAMEAEVSEFLAQFQKQNPG